MEFLNPAHGMKDICKGWLIDIINTYSSTHNALRISGGRTRELARVDDCPLQPLDGQARSAGQKADGNPQRDDAARSVRAIGERYLRVGGRGQCLRAGKTRSQKNA